MVALRIDHKPHLENILVTKADGTVVNLGKPEHPIIGDRLFMLRRKRYIKSRRAEFEAAGIDWRSYL